MAAPRPLVRAVSVDQLAAVLKHRKKVLIVDGRSFLEFNTCHVAGAVNVCCSKLMKRRLQHDKVTVNDVLTSACQVNVEKKVDVIVYDQSSNDVCSMSPDSFVFVLLQKLVSVFHSVSLLQGGFLEFRSKYLSLCEDKTRKCVPLVSLSQPCLPISNTGPTRILPFLYLGSQHDAMNKELLRDHDITYELNVSAACPKPDFISDRHFLRIPVNDNYSEKLLPHFPTAFQFVDKVREGNGCVLVHCLAGISRSPTVAIAYIMRYLHMSSDEAYRYVKSKRATISPNFNFLGQLLEYENQLRSENVLQRFHAAKESFLFSGQGNKRHCHTAMRMNEVKLPATCERATELERGSALKGDPLRAVAGLSCSSPDKDVQLETVNEESKVVSKVVKNGSPGPGVRKSQSTSNIWTLNNSSLWLNERRSSYDANAYKLIQHSRKLGRSCLKGQLDNESQKNITFEGLKTIPFSLLDRINFMPCRASSHPTRKVQETPTNCLMEPSGSLSFGASLQAHRLRVTQSDHEQSRASELDFSFPDTTSDLTDFYVAGEMAMGRSESPPREASPRPDGLPVAPLKCLDAKHDLIDEGIDLFKDECDEDGPAHQNECLDSKAYSGTKTSDTCKVELKAVGQKENLESSYDSGVFPSPTQLDLGEIIQSCRKTAMWSLEDKERSSLDCGTCDAKKSSADTMHVCSTAVNLDGNDSISKACTKFTTSVGSLALESSTMVTVSNQWSSFLDRRGPDRLYRAHSCPGILGWLYCSSQTADSICTNAEVPSTPTRLLRMPSFERAVQFRNRYSCGSLNVVEDRHSVTFDSCPDFGHYCKSRDESEQRYRDVSPMYHHRSFIRRTSIIRVS